MSTVRLVTPSTVSFNGTPAPAPKGVTGTYLTATVPNRNHRTCDGDDLERHTEEQQDIPSDPADYEFLPDQRLGGNGRDH
jgi:hypothetical protein